MDIFSKFLSLPKEKRNKILDAAMEEFSNKGYKGASTDAIIAKACISKGSLFAYFHNKENLYRYLVENASYLLKKEFYELIDLSSVDVFERLKNVSVAKIRLYREYPSLFDFIQASVKDDDSLAKEVVAKIEVNTLNEGFARIFKDIDYELFKENVDIKVAISIIEWSLAGYSQRELTKISIEKRKFTDEEYKKIMVEYEKIVSILRECFYKEAL